MDITELASEKQLKFMKSLGLVAPEGITKIEARIAIDRKLNKSDAEAGEEVEVVKPGEVKHGEKFYEEVKKDKTATMYTSYAKDIFVAICEKMNKTGQLEEDMDTAIKLVKQAKEAFE